jgi:hypothetical protein
MNNEKVVILGDTHGRPIWKDIVNTETFDKIVFLGDYFDTRDHYTAKQQAENFQDIIAYKEANQHKVILLIGNHDFHYTNTGIQFSERYSGFQMDSVQIFNHLLQTYKDLLQMAYFHNGYLFTHAGVTKTWLKRTLGLTTDDNLDFVTKIDDYINDVWKFTPRLFLFHGNDPYGDDIEQSPIWVRPQSLNEDAFDAIHVVGHTTQKRMANEPVKFLNAGRGMFIDCLGTSGEYLTIENGKTVPKKLQTL